MVYLTEEIKQYIFSFLGGEKYTLDVTKPEVSSMVVKQKNKRLRAMMIGDIASRLTEHTKTEFLRLNTKLNNLEQNAVIPVVQSKSLNIYFPDFKKRGVCRMIKHTFTFGCEIDGIIGDTKFLGGAVYYIAFEKTRMNLFYMLSQSYDNERTFNNNTKHIHGGILYCLDVYFR
jgi:hypothetical protein